MEGAIGKDPGRFSWAKGIVGAIQRVRGAGAQEVVAPEEANDTSRR